MKASCRNDFAGQEMEETFEKTIPRPCLIPLTSIFLSASGVLEAEVNILSSSTYLQLCSSVDYATCGRYIAASGGRKVVILSTESKECIKRFTYHTAEVSVVKFASSSKLISASWDNRIAVWERERRAIPSVILRGHRGYVHGIELSRDATKFYSVSDDCTLELRGVTGGAALQTFS